MALIARCCALRASLAPALTVGSRGGPAMCMTTSRCCCGPNPRRDAQQWPGSRHVLYASSQGECLAGPNSAGLGLAFPVIQRAAAGPKNANAAKADQACRIGDTGGDLAGI